MATKTQRAALKTFHGPSMAQALAEVKRDLGPEAVILHTRTYRVGGVMGVGAKNMVEITASADAGVIRPRRVRSRESASFDAGLGMPATSAVTAPVAEPPPGAFIPTPPWFQPPRVDSAPAPETQPQALPKPTSAYSPPPKPERVESAPPRQAERTTEPPPEPTAETHERTATPARIPTTRVAPAPTTPQAGAVLEEELASIRRLVGQVLQSSRRVEARAGGAAAADSGASVSSGPLADLYLRMLENQVSAEVADGLVSAVRDELSVAELADAGVARESLLRQIAKRLPVSAEPIAPARASGDKPRVIAVVGPTGVGKTTTVAKLAANAKLRHGRKVGLVTADTYRIAAVEQLRTYADIVGLPMKVALTPREMTAALEQLSDCDVVFVDTAGRSQHDTARLGELAEFLDAAEPDESHLVLSLAAAESVMLAAADRFAQLRPSRVILSKLDEAVEFGVVANLAHRVALPVSHVTTGQEVPDHIEPASADRLARLVLEGRDAWSVLAGGR